MSKKKKVNPNRIPVKKEIKIASERSKAIKLVYVIVLYVLFDRMGMSAETVNEIYKHCLDVSDSIAKGYLNKKDIEKTLDEELDVKFEWG